MLPKIMRKIGKNNRLKLVPQITAVFMNGVALYGYQTKMFSIPFTLPIGFIYVSGFSIVLGINKPQLGHHFLIVRKKI
jgi:hypothetical protein